MSLWLQNLIVFLAVGASAFFIVRQTWATLAGKRSKLGSCCSKGCGASEPAKSKTQQTAFIPVEMLGRKK